MIEIAPVEVCHDRAAPIYAVVDVPEDAASAVVELTASGAGDVLLDDVVVSRIERDPSEASSERLDARRIARLEALTRAIGLVRYFHPSDQSTDVDWDAFTVEAVSRAIAVDDDSAFRAEMHALLTAVAPTAAIYADGEKREPIQPEKGHGTHLTRWRHLGFGSTVAYETFREGLDTEPETAIVVYAEVPHEKWKGCRSLRTSVVVHAVTGAPDAAVEIRARREARVVDEEKERIDLRPGGASTAEYEVAKDARHVSVAIRFGGYGTLKIRDVAAKCDGRAIDLPVDLGTWELDGRARFLYTLEAADCDSARCFELRRERDQFFDPVADVIDVSIGAGLRLAMPTAVWTDGQRTFPTSRGIDVLPTSTVLDRSARIAAVLTAWVTLDHFFPHFDDIETDWKAVLPSVLQSAALAESPAELHRLLWTMTAMLHDAHALVKHPAAPIDGLLPLYLHWIDGSLIVAGGIEAYMQGIPPGTRVLEIDGVPAADAFRAQRVAVAAGTDANLNSLTAYYLAMGPLGELATLTIQQDGQSEEVIAIPRVDRAKWGSQVAEKRPANGEELAPGVIYADMQEVDAAAWDQLLPAATAAEVVIMDLRGYPTGDGLQILSRFMSSAARSPRFDIPIVGPTSPSQFGYETYRWFVEPTSPRLSAQLVVLVDARPQSYAETVLQLIKESSLAVLVGEPSAGTNGNVATFVVPGGFTVRFTAMRTLFEDGSTVHARGVQPDIVVHPTLQGIREGRDEILEADLALAREMIASERSTSSN